MIESVRIIEIAAYGMARRLVTKVLNCMPRNERHILFWWCHWRLELRLIAIANRPSAKRPSIRLVKQLEQHLSYSGQLGLPCDKKWGPGISDKDHLKMSGRERQMRKMFSP